VHMAKMNLGAPADPPVRAAECPWRLGAMLLVATVVLALGVWLPRPLYSLVRGSAAILGGGL